jgi:glycosyltransferase involved in cell wall biosynthesis
MIRYLFFKIYNRLKAVTIRSKAYPVFYNVNAVNESNYDKRALIMYVVKPFLLKDDDPGLLTHQNLKQCRQIAALLGEFGYIVDVVDIRDKKFTPSSNYALVINSKASLRGMDTSFYKDAIKIFLATTENHLSHNRNLQRRHELLSKRREHAVKFRRIYSEVMPYATRSDAIVGFGNEFIMNTWKEVFKGPAFSFNNYGFKETVFSSSLKDFEQARKHFLFFASSSQMQKGLDLLLEIFPRHPDLHLYICSGFKKESDFCACYYKELYKTPNIHPIGWTKVNSSEFYELVKKCAYVIHPTCSEGQPGSVVQCMYSGLIPLVTKEAGIDTEDFGITFSDDSLEEVERVIVEVSQKSEEWHREQSIKTRKVAEEKYSEEAFINRWRDILNEILNNTGPKNDF